MHFHLVLQLVVLQGDHAVGDSVQDLNIASGGKAVSGATYTDTSGVSNGTDNNTKYFGINVSTSGGKASGTHKAASAAIKAID